MQEEAPSEEEAAAAGEEAAGEEAAAMQEEAPSEEEAAAAGEEAEAAMDVEAASEEDEAAEAAMEVEVASEEEEAAAAGEEAAAAMEVEAASEAAAETKTEKLQADTDVAKQAPPRKRPAAVNGKPIEEHEFYELMQQGERSKLSVRRNGDCAFLSSAAGFTGLKGLTTAQAMDPSDVMDRVDGWRLNSIQYVQAFLRREGSEEDANILEAWKGRGKWDVAAGQSGAAFHVMWGIAKELNRTVRGRDRTCCTAGAVAALLLAPHPPRFQPSPRRWSASRATRTARTRNRRSSTTRRSARPPISRSWSTRASSSKVPSGRQPSSSTTASTTSTHG